MERALLEVTGGWLGLGWSSRGVALLLLPNPERAESERRLVASLPQAMPGQPPAELCSLLEDYLAGRGAWPRWPVDLEGGTHFRRRVWQELQRIPPGETHTYGEVAQNIGVPAGARAVGGACAANPVPLLVPCHRVVGRHGLGGFSGGAGWKDKLLELERRVMFWT